MSEATEEQRQENTKEFQKENLEVVYDIPVEVMVVLGKASMSINQILKLAKGSVLELDKNVGEPVDMYVNGKLVAKGEVVIVENKIGITLTELTKDN